MTDAPTPAELAEDEPKGCRCTHDTRNPEVGCTSGYADWLSDGGDEYLDRSAMPKPTSGSAFWSL